MRRGVWAAIASAGLALLSGCAGPEPFDRLSTWRPTGANAANLAAMAARPAELARGRGTGPTDGQVVTAAVERLRYGRLKPIGDTSAGGGGGNVGSPLSGASGAAALTGN